MKKFIFILLFLFSVSTIYAVLPPLYHSLTEIESIISDERLAKELGSAEAIIGINKTKDGYLITTFRYQLKVDVIYIPQEMSGPVNFELKFYEKEHKNKQLYHQDIIIN